MDKKVWTTPFGLALIIGSALALIAGYAYGTNVVSLDSNGYNAMAGPDNFSGTLDENLLIEDPSGPATATRLPKPDTPAAPSPAEPKEKEAEGPDIVPAEPVEEPPVEITNEADND